MYRKFIFCLTLTLAFTSVTFADTLKRIRDSGVVRIGYRIDAAPYSFNDPAGEPAGYSVELCRVIAASLKQQLKLNDITIKYIPVTAESRFKAITKGRIDLLCGATTATLSRRQLVDFSLPIFVDGASVLLTKNGPGSFEELNGKKVGVRGGTTTADGLSNTLKRLSIKAKIVPVKNHQDGLKNLQKKKISAYFADRSILIYLMLSSKNPDQLLISEDYFSHEPYALGLARGDSDFRLAVDTALSRIYSSGTIEKIVASTFGKAELSDIVKTLYLISSLPE